MATKSKKARKKTSKNRASKKVAKKTAKKSAKKTVKKTVKKSAKKTAKKSAKKTVKKTVKKTAIKSAKKKAGSKKVTRPRNPLLAIKDVGGIVRYHAKKQPDALSLVLGDRTLTWAQLLSRSAQVAQGLKRAGVKAQDRVAFLDKNGI